jgi:hypothetical protein
MIHLSELEKKRREKQQKLASQNYDNNHRLLYKIKRRCARIGLKLSYYDGTIEEYLMCINGQPVCPLEEGEHQYDSRDTALFLGYKMAVNPNDLPRIERRKVFRTIRQGLKNIEDNNG